MNILALETSGKYGTAAVINECGKIWSAASSGELNHLRDIITISDEAIRLAGITRKDLTHVAASKGPGSFTGIRIGVTTARTMGQMLGIPCIGVSSLLAMGERVLDKAVSEGALYISAIINARRHQVYAGVWEACFTSDFEQKTLCPFMEEKQYMIEDLLAELKEHQKNGGTVFFTGDGIDAYEEIIRGTLEEGAYVLADESIRYQNAEDVAGVALRYAQAGKVTGYGDLLPEYMRLSEAEQRLKEGTLSEKIRRTVR